MRPDPALVIETRQWFVKAAHDLRMAELALCDRPPLADQAAFHAQQAAAVLARLPREVRP